MILMYLVLGVAISLYWAYTGFLTVASAERILAAGLELPIGFKIVAYLWYARGLWGDFIGNIYLGLTEFHELPQWDTGELMFSSRVQRHIDLGPNGTHYATALKWARILNAAVPGHIKRVPA